MGLVLLLLAITWHLLRYAAFVFALVVGMITPFALLICVRVVLRMVEMQHADVRAKVAVIEGFEAVMPAIVFSCEQHVGSGQNFVGSDCNICVSPFEEGMSRIRVLPSCAHGFHSDCIDSWLSANRATSPSCPTCRTLIHLPLAKFARTKHDISLVAYDSDSEQC